MEKFGLFELLDALSALTAAGNEVPPATQQNKSDPFAPPSYAGTPAETKAVAPSGGSDALSSLLRRHEAVSRRVDGKK